MRRRTTVLAAVAVPALLLGGLALANPAWLPLGRSGEATDPPAASFPHWSHQQRFKCYSCHPSLFSMREKASWTHAEMDAGGYCGACHDGKVAFAPFDASDCSVCHIE